MNKMIKNAFRSLTAVSLLSSTMAFAPVPLLGMQVMQANACNLQTAVGPIGPNGEAFANVTTYCAPDEAQLYAAIAISDSTLTWGSSWGWNSPAAAEQEAVAECSRNASDCRSVIWATGCAALAVSDNDQAWGSAYNNFYDFAEASALQNCKDEGGTSCKVVTHPCSGDE